MKGQNISPPKTTWKGREKCVQDFQNIVVFAAF
jgi:hypothetical protein